MTRLSRLLAALFAILVFAGPRIPAQSLAPTPPMGWNSWDAYGPTIDEDQFKANAAVLASLQPYGWKYAVIDLGWFMANPMGHSLEQKFYVWNRNGLLIPAPGRFPSSANGAGFKPLADWVHARGLKFGIYILRGIPRQVVAANLPIAGTRFRAVDAADTNAPCSWFPGTWGVKDNPAGQAYYNSMIKLYASWGVDFLKVDCIAGNPYRISEVRQIAKAIRETGRPIVLSLATGPPPLNDVNELARLAQMWRISDDHWDGWILPHKPGGEFPFGIKEAFDRLALWSSYAGPSHWPDPDMLPEGWLGPSPGWGFARASRETLDEQRTEFALWCFARAPLFFGGNMTHLSALSRSLLTNRALLAIDQNANSDRPIPAGRLGPAFSNLRVWRATVTQAGSDGGSGYIAISNLAGIPATVHLTWKQLGLKGSKHSAHNIWDNSTIQDAKGFGVTLSPHGSAVLALH